MKRFKYTAQVTYRPIAEPGQTVPELVADHIFEYESDSCFFRSSGAFQHVQNGFWVAPGYWVAPGAILGVTFVRNEENPQ